MSAQEFAAKFAPFLAPPRFRCRECRQTHPKTIFDLPEADGSYTCQPCELALAIEHREANFDVWEGADRG